MIYCICNGEDPECSKQECYLNGGCCRHTSKLDYGKYMLDHKKHEMVHEGDYWEEIECELSDEEKSFIITCIINAAAEWLNCFPRYINRYDENSGIKYDRLSSTQIVDLIRKLGGDEDDLEEFYQYIANC